MFCKKCGTLIEEGTKFCGNCGTPVEFVQQQNTTNNINSQPVNPVTDTNSNISSNNTYNSQQNVNYNPNNENYDNIINPSMKKYAILSIVIPSIALFVYFFIGLSFYIAILLAGVGFSFAQKGKMYSKKMSTAGVVLNTILTVVACIMLVILIISAIMQ